MRGHWQSDQHPLIVTYISPTQINVLLPADLQPGPVKIQTFNNGLSSQTTSVTLQAEGSLAAEAGGAIFAAGSGPCPAAAIRRSSLLTLSGDLTLAFTGSKPTSALASVAYGD